MPNFPYSSEKIKDTQDDYETVSFEDFCDKSSESKTDLLTLNDNINYRLYYECDKNSKSDENNGETSSRIGDQQNETSLSDPCVGNIKKKCSFDPFGCSSHEKSSRRLFSGVLPKQRDGEASMDHRYQRFSDRRSGLRTLWDSVKGFSSGMLAIALVCALCVAVWWAVSGALQGSWGEEHYRRLWERAHPDNTKKPLTPIPYEKILSEYRYHDHNNLSTKNKFNLTDLKKNVNNKKETYTERPVEVMRDMCAKVADNMRFDCFPQDEANEKDCIKRGCCWKEAKPGGPYCFYPPQYDTYKFVNMTENKHGITVQYEKARPSGYPGDFNMATVRFNYLSDDVVQIKIFDSENKRFEPPYPEIPMAPGPISKLNYRVVVESSTVGFKIVRNSDNVTIINTQDIGGLILSDKFLQISSILPTGQVFGLGEKRSRFMNDMNWKTYGFFNRDQVPVENTNLYGTHPFYLAVEKDGNSHGMLLLNSNALAVVLQPTPAITYRAIGGVLNMLAFVGPTPSKVVAQYVAVVGKPFMPPYWSLGFHLCKFGYGSLNATRDVWQKNRDAGVPFDVQWNDLDYMEKHNDFTYDKVKFSGLPQFVKKIHDEGMHYVVLIDPGVSAAEKPGEYPPFDRGVDLDIFIKNSSNYPFLGKVWNDVSTAFPDFTHPSSTAYWVEMLLSLHKDVPFDGAWIDMNEPSNMVSGSLGGHCAPEELPYRPPLNAPDGLQSKTLCMEARHFAGAHFDLHNLYSLMEGIATNFAMTEIRGKRPFVISRSTFSGSGQYVGHWSGDIASQWHDMAMTIPELLSFSLFGIPMMGADICGFNGNTTVELCKRWMQLGAFYPFSRNHNSIGMMPQDPASMGGEVLEASRISLRLRYKLLPYYYTLFWKAHMFGDTVVRPLLFEYPQYPELYDIDTQFLIGPYIMVTPILKQGTTKAKAFVPGPESWYNINTGRSLLVHKWQDVGENDTISVRGSAIIPLQEPPKSGPVSTTLTRSMPLQLLVVPHNGAGTGELYWDDGDSLNTYEENKYSQIEFMLQSSELRSIVHWWGFGVPPLNRITVLGQSSPIRAVLVNGVNCPFIYHTNSQVLEINLDLSLDKPFIVTWTYKTNIIFKPNNNTTCQNGHCNYIN